MYIDNIREYDCTTLYPTSHTIVGVKCVIVLVISAISIDWLTDRSSKSWLETRECDQQQINITSFIFLFSRVLRDSTPR